MIPILFSGDATTFTTNGIGRLTDVISCQVTEERNGEYTLEMVISTTTPHFDDLICGNIIVATPYKNGSRQAFEIYEITRPLNQQITVRANHISYRGSYIPVAPHQSTGITQTMSDLISNSLVTNPFTLTSDFTNQESSYVQNLPKSFRSCLGGSEGSLLDVFASSGAGEFLWDNFAISFLMHRGADNGVQYRYAKNITDIEQVEDFSNTISGVLPYYSNFENSVVVYGDIQYASNHADFDVERIAVLDLSDHFDFTPSLSQLNQAGAEYIANSGVNTIVQNISLSFIDLSEAEITGQLEDVNLCDTVTVIYTPLNVSFKSKVIKTVWDVLKERYTSIEIGKPKSELSKTLAGIQNDVSSVISTGQKLVSIVQTIDYEIGEFQRTITTIEETQETILENQSQITQRADGIELRVSQNESDINDSNERISELENRVVITAEDTKFMSASEDSYVSIKYNEIQLVVEGQAQVDITSEGIKANSYQAGEWVLQQSNSGKSFNIFRKG